MVFEREKALLAPYHEWQIDWNLTPEHAVTMYLEWGNNDWSAEYGPVTSKEDYSTYFVVDTWNKEPLIRLVRRNSEGATDLVSFPVPEHLLPVLKEEVASIKGIFAPNETIRSWLKEVIGKE